MKQKKHTILAISLAVLTAVAFSSCKRDTVGLPDPTGPSTLATILKMGASPNVIAAGLNERQTATVTAHLYKFDGQPLSGRTVHFEVRDAMGFKANYGYLDGSMTVVSKLTDGAGNVSVTYTGPIASELDFVDNFILYVYAWVGWQGREEISELCSIHIVGDLLADLALEFELQAFPNVLWVTSSPATSVIRGIYTYQNGLPVVGRKVFFEIKRGPGTFEDGLTKTFAVTNANGVAELLYMSPTNAALTAAETWVTIEGQPETDWIHIIDPYDPLDEDSKFWLHKEMDIKLIKGTGNN
jgi:hypothetical protein